MSFAHRAHNSANDSHIEFINADSSLSCVPLNPEQSAEAVRAVERADFRSK